MAPRLNMMWSWITRSRTEEEDKASLFMKNGSLLLKCLLASCEGRYHPYRNFTAKEIISATNNFREPKTNLGWVHIYMGCFENRLVSIHTFFRDPFRDEYRSLNDMVVTSQVSYHRNVLKLLGCCLEFAIPALVYECPSQPTFLCDLIYDHEKVEPLPWKSRLRVARDIASVLVYLHTAFSTPIIYRDLKPENIVIDGSGVAKLFNFSLCLPLPPGKLELEDKIVGTYGFAETNYLRNGTITTKTDVYNFGVFLLVLLTRQKPIVLTRSHCAIVTHVKECVGEDRLKKIVDPVLLNDRMENTEVWQLQSFLELAERCTMEEREDRPEMIDVANELKRIERSSTVKLN